MREAPLLQAEIEIDAPPEKVWKLISDFSRMPEWSPQCRWMKPLGPVRPGTHTINLNRRRLLFWPTTSTVTEVVPNKTLAFKIGGNDTVWRYELEPSANGTRLVESRHSDGIRPALLMVQDRALGGVENFEVELIDGMNATLARIKAAAERQ